MRVAELLEHARVGRELSLGRLLPGLQAELLVQDLPQLRRRVEVELLAGLRVDLGLQRRHAVADRLPHLLEVVDVEPDAARLHAGEHRRERQLDVVEQAAEPLLVDALLHHGREQRDRGGLGRARLRHGASANSCPSPSSVSLDRPEHVGAEVGLGERAQRVVGRRRVEQVAGEQRVERDAGDRAARAKRHPLERLRVVRPLRRAGVGEERPRAGRLRRARRTRPAPRRRRSPPPAPRRRRRRAGRPRARRRPSRRQLGGRHLAQIELGDVDLRLHVARSPAAGRRATGTRGR